MFPLLCHELFILSITVLSRSLHFCPRALEGFLLGKPFLVQAVAAMDLVVKAGPFELPDGGKHGTLTWQQRQTILERTGVSAAVRERRQTGGKRHLTLSGPMSGMEEAKTMAMEYVIESQKKQVPFAETPGSKLDWEATIRQQPGTTKRMSKRPSTSSSSWMPMTAPQPPQMMMMMMPQMQQMHQPQPCFMQPMYVMMNPSFGCGMGSGMTCGMQQLRHQEPDDPSEEEEEEVVEEPAPWQQKPMPVPAEKKLKPVPLVERKPKLQPQCKKIPKSSATLKSAASVLAAERIPAATDDDEGDGFVQTIDDDDDVGRGTDRPLTLHRTVDPMNKKRRLVSCQISDGCKTVNIMTVGWRQQGCKYCHDFEELVAGNNGLLSKLRMRGFMEPDIVVDCRPLKRHDLPRHILKHTGFNATIIDQAVGHTLFKPTMKAVVDDIKESVTESAPKAVLAVCTSGTHRSVAFALTLANILDRMSYRTKMRHLSWGTWKSRGLCWNCEDCDDANELKAEIFDKAFKIVTE